MATDYGYDLALTDDFDPMFPEISGREVLVQALFRRLSTPRGGLNFEPIAAPDYGFDLRDLIGEGFEDTDLFEACASIANEVLKDERVLAARAEIQLSRVTRAAVVRLTVQDAAGPFPFVLAVDAVSVSILREG